MSRLYEIDAQIQGMLDLMVEPETGEISDDSLAMLKELDIERNVVIENIVLHIKNRIADAAAIKNEIEILYKRQKSAEKHADRMKKYLTDTIPGEKLETPRVTISWRKSSSVHIENESDFIRIYKDSDFLTPQDPKINKTNIGNALKSGEEVRGAEIVTTQHIQIK